MSEPAGLSGQRVAYEDCLLWQLSDAYFQQRGKTAWFTKEMPFLITSNLQYAYQLAWVVHAAIQSSRPVPDQPIEILEIGAGHGVFSVFFLKAFQDVCRLEKSDYSQRLHYLITDYSPRFAAEIAANPLLHQRMQAGRVDVGLLDITRPEHWRSLSGEVHALAPASLHAVICNYVLDTLPQTVYRLEAGLLSKKTIEVQPATGPQGRLPEHLFRLQDLLLVTYFEPCAWDSVQPVWVRELLQTQASAGLNGLLPFSAPGFAGIQALFELLLPSGLLWVADKGFIDPLPLTGMADFWPSFHGLAAAHKVNFPLLQHFLQQQLGAAALLTPRADQHLKTLAAQKAPQADLALQESYRYNFVSHNRNEQTCHDYDQDSEKVLRGEGHWLDGD